MVTVGIPVGNYIILLLLFVFVPMFPWKV